MTDEPEDLVKIEDLGPTEVGRHLYRIMLPKDVGDRLFALAAELGVTVEQYLRLHFGSARAN